MTLTQQQTTLDIYKIHQTFSIKECMKKIENNEKGIIFVEDDNCTLIGSITDGDIRRYLIDCSSNSINDLLENCLNKDFKFFYENEYDNEQLLRAFDSKIHTIPILNKSKKLIRVVSSKDTLINYKENINIAKAKAPVRISFFGGGTDITNHFISNSGAVLNATINKYIHVTLIKKESKEIIIKSVDLELSERINSIDQLNLNGKLGLIKAVIQLMNPDFGFELITRSEIPAGSGLGGSAVLSVAIIGAFNMFRSQKLTKYEISEIAFQAERILCNISGGWQDQYASVFGGFNFMEFNQDENIINPLRLSQETILDLEDCLFLCYTGINHISSDIHNVQKETMKNDEIKLLAEKSRQIAYKMKKKFLKNEISDFGYYLNETWKLKRKFAKNISNSELDLIYEYAIKAGASGAKLLGAGGGGYFLFYVKPKNQYNFIKIMKKKLLQIEQVCFENKGLQTTLSKE